VRRMLPDYYSRRVDMRYAVLQGYVHSGHRQWRCAGSVLLCWQRGVGVLLFLKRLEESQ